MFRGSKYGVANTNWEGDYMTMLKKSLMLLMVFAALWSAETVCQAEILPPYGQGQIGLQAVVLCESLTVHQDRSVDSKAVKTLLYGDTFIVQDKWDG